LGSVRLNGVRGLKLGLHFRGVNVPEIPRRLHELDSDLRAAVLLRPNVDHAALAFFLREAIDDENSLALLEIGRNGDARTVRVHIQRSGVIAKRLIVRRASVHDDGNMKGESAAAPNVAAGFRLLYGSRHTSNTITLLQGVAQECVSENAPAPGHRLGEPLGAVRRVRLARILLSWQPFTQGDALASY